MTSRLSPALPSHHYQAKLLPHRQSLRAPHHLKDLASPSHSDLSLSYFTYSSATSSPCFLLLLLLFFSHFSSSSWARNLETAKCKFLPHT